MKTVPYLSVAVCLFLVPDSTANTLRFLFGEGTSADDAVAVSSGTAYSKEKGFGFTGPAVRESRSSGETSAVTSSEPFFFHVDLDEGNYRVRALLGGIDETGHTTVKAESRRLMVRDIATGPGETTWVEFTVNIRTPALPGGGEVALNSREIGVPHWDDRLTLEFGGARPALAALEIRPDSEAVTVYLAGDSTVTDQVAEPWCAWGQMLTAYFGAEAAVANHAESGLSIRSFIAQRRLEKVFSTFRPGDYLFVQFGHNDQKESGEGIGPFQSYAEALTELAAEVRERGGHPVFVTSMYRRRFSGGELRDTLGDFPVAMRQVAEREDVPLIDLHAQSGVLFEALGPDESRKAFVHYPGGTFPGQDEVLRDDSHFSPYGGDLLARCVVAGIREKVPELAAHLRTDLPEFDPASPPSPNDWFLTPSPPADFARPAGD